MLHLRNVNILKPFTPTTNSSYRQASKLKWKKKLKINVDAPSKGCVRFKTSMSSTISGYKQEPKKKKWWKQNKSKMNNANSSSKKKYGQLKTIISTFSCRCYKKYFHFDNMLTFGKL